MCEAVLFSRLMSLDEIEAAVATSPEREKEELLRQLSVQLSRSSHSGWPVPPPDVPKEELRRVHALIETEFSRMDEGGR